MNSITLKLGLRTLYRNKLYTILNVLGLSIGYGKCNAYFFMGSVPG